MGNFVLKNILLISIILSSLICCVTGLALGAKVSDNPILFLMDYIKNDGNKAPEDNFESGGQDDGFIPDFIDPEEEEGEFNPDFDFDETDPPETTLKPETDPPTTNGTEQSGGMDTAVDSSSDTTKITETKPAETKPAETTRPPIVNTPVTQPDYPQVEDPDYFKDALFIGDSRTVGLSSYGKIAGAKYYAKTSMSVFNCLTVSSTDTGQNQTLLKYLSENKFGKIYILLGINEIGYSLNNIANKYKKIIEEIHKIQPDAKIIIQSNMNVTEKKSLNSPNTFNNTRINKLNSMLLQLANGKVTYFLDVSSPFNDENGNMKSEYSGDGVHLKGKYYYIWRDVLTERGKF